MNRDLCFSLDARLFRILYSVTHGFYPFTRPAILLLFRAAPFRRRLIKLRSNLSHDKTVRNLFNITVLRTILAHLTRLSVFLIGSDYILFKLHVYEANASLGSSYCVSFFPYVGRTAAVFYFYTRLHTGNSPKGDSPFCWLSVNRRLPTTVRRIGFYRLSPTAKAASIMWTRLYLWHRTLLVVFHVVTAPGEGNDVHSIVHEKIVRITLCG